MSRRLLGILVLGTGILAACSAPPPPGPAPGPSPSPSASAEPLPATPGVPLRPVAEHRAPAVPGFDSPDRRPVSSDDVTGLPAAPGPGLEAYWGQELRWQDCGPAECATVLVPLDWERPGLAALEIAVTRLPATVPLLGPLFLNPGGPGGPARPVVQGMQPGSIPGFDVVGWDPRGTGESTAVRCAPEALSAAYQADGSPDTGEEEALLRQAWQGLAESCREHSGILLDHVSTIDSARDLDLLRHLFGMPRVSFLGISYGSLLGATYAELFPERVGRMVLDGAVDVTGARPLVSLAALEQGLRTFANWCGAEDGCGLGGSGSQVLDRISALLQQLDAAPLAVGSRTLTQSLAVRGIAGSLYWGEQHYPALARDVQQALDGDGAGLLYAADLNVDYDDGWLPAASALLAIACSDRPDQGFRAALDAVAEARPAAPILAASLGTQPMCEFWTAPAKPPLQLRAAGAPPILVLGRTGDPLTPLAAAQELASGLDSGHLVTVDGAGHTSLNRRDPCVENIVARYLTLGIIPERGASCPAR